MDTQSICEQIRKKIKEKGYTQEEFAKILKISSPTLKRWLRGEGLLFKDLTNIIDKLDIKLSELSILAEGKSKSKFTYTIEQELAFASIEGLLAFFDQLLSGKKIESILKANKLTNKSLNFYLSKLDKINLIEWYPKNKIKILVTGEPSWIEDGPLSKKFRKEIVSEFIKNNLNSREQLRIGVYSLSTQSYKKISIQYQDLVENIRMMEIKDSSNQSSKRMTTILLGLSLDEINLLNSIPNK